MDIININDKIFIPASELEISFIRSGGPGGQHVNKTSTQAELVFDLDSPSIPEVDKAWLRTKLGSKLDSEGKLRITSQDTRSQLQNKKLVIEKFREMLRMGLLRPRKRKPTKPKRSAVEKRLESKRKHSENKTQRRGKFD